MSDLNRDIRGIRRIIDQQVPENLKDGVVISKLPKSVRVRITGSNMTVEAAPFRGADIKVGDNVILVRRNGQRRWMVLGAQQAGVGSGAGGSDSPDFTGALAPPSAFRVYSGWGFIVAMWDTPVQRPDVSWQIQVAEDIEGEESNAEYHVVSGHNYLSIQDPGTAKQLRVRAIDKLGNQSGWSEWISASSNTVFFNTGMSAVMPAASTAHEGEPFYAYDTRTLYIAHNNEWEAVLGGGGELPPPPDSGSGPGYWDVDLPPETPSAYDNEFTSAFADFTEHDPYSVMTPTIVAGDQLQLVYAPGIHDNYLAGMWKQLPAGAYTITTKVKLLPNTDIPGAGWLIGAGFVLRSAAPSEVDDLTSHGFLLNKFCTPDYDTAHHVVNIWQQSGMLAGGALVVLSALKASMTMDSWIYLRVRFPNTLNALGNYTYYFDASVDGIIWESMAQSFIQDPYPYVGLFVNSNEPTGGETVTGLFEFFRYDSVVHTSDKPVYGQWVGQNLSSNANVVSDVASFNYQSAASMSLGDLDAGEHVHEVGIIIDTPFDGTVTIKVGDVGNNERLMAASMNDPTEAGQYINFPEHTYLAAAQPILYLDITGSTQGAGRIVIKRKEAYA